MGRGEEGRKEGEGEREREEGKGRREWGEDGEAESQKGSLHLSDPLTVL